MLLKLCFQCEKNAFEYVHFCVWVSANQRGGAGSKWDDFDFVLKKMGREKKKKRRETLKHLYDWRHVELAELAVRKF